VRFGSVCSGIEAASVAWNPIGFEAAWLAEIEPFPCAVLAHHYPEVPNLGDMTTIAARIESGEVEAPDLFCGGTPCQAFSVAGLRNSLDDARGNLSLIFCEIANAIDHARSVRGLESAVIFWENVPGVLNTKDNAFGCFLGALAGEDDPVTCADGKWSTAGVVVGQTRTVAWRVLDAQYFGVAQRRRRVFVIASARADFDPAAVLFESEGVRRDIAPSREAGQDVAGTIEASLGRSRGAGTPVSAITMAHGQGGAEIGYDRGPTLTCNHEAPILAFDTTQITSAANGSNPKPGDPCHPLAARAHVPAIAFSGQMSNPQTDVGMTQTLQAKNPMAVAFRETTDCLTAAYGTKWNGNASATNGSLFVAQPIGWSEELTASVELAGTIQRGGDGGRHDGVMNQAMQVRRLTPVECERLQGFPDNYTNIPWRKKPDSPDGPRYKSLGNSWAVPVVRWLGKRIKAAL
jgi:DNA (cytosine-5)-methyltransferase 1